MEGSGHGLAPQDRSPNAENYLQDFETSPHAHDRIYTYRFYAGLGLVF